MTKIATKNECGTLTIENGNRVREWLVFAGSMIGMIIAATLVWATLTGRVDYLEKDNAKIHEEGTKISQQATRDIIAIKSDIKYTREAVDKIDRRLEYMGARVQ